MKKAICILLIASMLIPFSSCSENEVSNPKTTDNSAADGVGTGNGTVTASGIEYEKDSLPELDFGGETVTILSLEGQYDNSFYETAVTVEDLNSNAVNDSIYNREIFVEDRLGVEINNVKVQSVTGEIDKELNSGDDNYDGFIHVNHILSKYVFEEYLADLKTVNYLDFDKPWWSDKFNKEAEIFGELYFSTGSLCLSLIKNTYAVFYNKALAENYEESVPELGNLYELVDCGAWTFDKFVELGGEIYQDINGNSIRDLEDIYGIGFDNGCAIDAVWSGFDLSIFSRTSDGWFEFDVNPEKLYDTFNRLSDMLYGAKGSVVNGIDDEEAAFYGDENAVSHFASGSHLFFVEAIGYTDSELLRNMQDDYGLLPFPKYDENQKEYYSFSHDTFASVAIPITNSNPDLVGAVFEAMASYSYRNTMPTYLDVVLKGQYMSDPQSRKMVDIIVDGIALDAAWIYLHTLASEYPTSYRYAVMEGERSFASMHTSGEKKVATVLKVYRRQFED